VYDNIKLGDLISQIHPSTFEHLKIGIVTDAQKINFVVKWIWYDKYFFMEQEDSLFNELNREYLLTSTTIHRRNDELVLKILNSGSQYGMGKS
jgi:hypothetical protein|tara:strand:+ start:257 stop:535 length:279 start_codon:yes stop_codon:yes gene_type:complete